jgi:hypothetical protein
METTRQSISSNGADPTKAAIDREYIRNVLVQFFEHKDKRVSHGLGCESDLTGTIAPSVVNVAKFFKSR